MNDLARAVTMCQSVIVFWLPLVVMVIMVSAALGCVTDNVMTLKLGLAVATDTPVNFEI